MFPSFVISEHRFARRAGHRAEAVTQQVNTRSQSWEFFAAAVDLRSGFHVFSGRTESAQYNSQGQRPWLSRPGALPQAISFRAFGASSANLTDHFLNRGRIC